MRCQYGRLGRNGPCGEPAVVVDVMPPEWKNADDMPLCARHATPISHEDRRAIRRVSLDEYARRAESKA